MLHLALALAGEGHYAEAEKLQRETLDIQRRVLGPEDTYTLLSMNNLAAYLLSTRATMPKRKSWTAKHWRFDAVFRDRSIRTRCC